VNTPSPIQTPERTIIIDVLRGFALFGVLLGNFSSMISNNVPSGIIQSHLNSVDHSLDILHSIFIQNKFMTLFSILFGYGFGVIMERLVKKDIHPNGFFLRRMFWLFVFGCLNLLLWNGDILHIYAMTGIFLLLFRRKTDGAILIYSILFLIFLPFAIRLYQRLILQYSIDVPLMVSNYYHTYKYGSLSDVARLNYSMYPKQWIFSWVEWRDMSETLGRFLLGYFILRKKYLLMIEENVPLIKRIWKWTLLITILYAPFQLFIEFGRVSIPPLATYSLLKIGILSMSLFYATSITLIYYKKRLNRLLKTFRYLGCMTLTNYLTHTILFVIIFYGVGLGLLGDFSFSIVWLGTFLIYAAQGIFSKWWMQHFYFGPVEWIWRQLTYKKKFPLRKQTNIAVS